LPSGSNLFKIAINKCRDTACRVRSQSPSYLSKIACHIRLMYLDSFGWLHFYIPNPNKKSLYPLISNPLPSVLLLRFLSQDFFIHSPPPSPAQPPQQHHYSHSLLSLHDTDNTSLSAPIKQK